MQICQKLSRWIPLTAIIQLVGFLQQIVGGEERVIAMEVEAFSLCGFIISTDNCLESASALIRSSHSIQYDNKTLIM